MTQLAYPEVDIALETIVREELDKLPPCQSTNHPRGVFGHVPADSAAWLCGTPCGSTWMACAGWVEYLAQGSEFICQGPPHACGDTHKVADVTLVPLRIF